MRRSRGAAATCEVVLAAVVLGRRTGLPGIRAPRFPPSPSAQDEERRQASLWPQALTPPSGDG